MTPRHVLAGSLLLATGLATGIYRFNATFGPPAPGGTGEDIAAAAARLRQSPDPRADALATGRQDVAMAFVLSLDASSLPPPAQGALRLSGLHGDLRRALLQGSGLDAEALARALDPEQGGRPERRALVDALCPLLDGEDETLARGAADLACGLPELAAQVGAACAGVGLRGQALGLVLQSCGDPGPAAQALLLAHLDPDDPLAPVAALELARRGDPSALPALEAAAAASPDSLPGLTAGYGVVVLSRISARATQPAEPR